MGFGVSELEARRPHANKLQVGVKIGLEFGMKDGWDAEMLNKHCKKT